MSESKQVDSTITPPLVAEKQDLSATAQHVDENGRVYFSKSETTKSSPWNALLVFSCLCMGASSVLFGYDDRIISPVAATEEFVSRILNGSKSLVMRVN